MGIDMNSKTARYNFDKARALIAVGFNFTNIEEPLGSFCRRDTFFILLDQVRADVVRAGELVASDARPDYETRVPLKIKTLVDMFPSQQVHINRVRDEWNQLQDCNCEEPTSRISRRPSLKICN